MYTLNKTYTRADETVGVGKDTELSSTTPTGCHSQFKYLPAKSIFKRHTVRGSKIRDKGT